MAQTDGFFSGQTLRRFFGGADAVLERRVSNLAVAVERRQGPPCVACGFGSMYVIQGGMADAGKLRCDRLGCHHMTERDTAVQAA